jgi:uncharacterized protein
MKLFQNKEPALQVVTAYDEKSVTINHIRFSRSIIVLPDASPALWPVSDPDNLTPDDFSAVIAARPDLLIVGTGMRQRFLSPRLIVYFSSQKIGIEYMNTRAACRTFNLLLSEGRRVALALFMEDDT